MRVECPGVVSTDPLSGAPLCTDGVSVILAWVPVGEFDPADLDLVIGGEAFAAGFIIVATCWVIGRGAKIVLSMLN